MRYGSHGLPYVKRASYASLSAPGVLLMQITQKETPDPSYNSSKSSRPCRESGPDD